MRGERRWLAWLAAAAPLPLPFNQVLAWPLLFLYEAVVIAAFQRNERGEERWLPNWALNLLGLVYIPFLVLDLRFAFYRGRIVVALLHLLLFVVAVKLCSMTKSSDRWFTLAAIFFLFVGAMATSSHVTIAIYLLGFVALTLGALARFVALHERVGEALVDSAPRRGRPGVRWASFALGAILIAVGIPIFALIPRFEEPFILGRGTGGASLSRTSGFSDVVDLSLTTSIRANRNVVLRVQYDDPDHAPDNPRFKAATYARYVDRRWHRWADRPDVMAMGSENGFEVGSWSGLAETHRVEVYQEPIGSPSVVLPVETVWVAIPGAPHLMVDPGGAALLPGVPRETFRYEAGLADGLGLVGPTVFAGGVQQEAYVAALGEDGLTPRIRELAEGVLGDGTSSERAERLEAYLSRELTYTLDFVGRSAEHPIEDFLFTHRSGHCELFASAMVLMLRAEGIPARLVTGFLGSEYNPLEDYYIVRQQNAHAWVEAWVGETEGWRIYDPTPPDGRPVAAELSATLLLQQLYDWMTFRWDRYVLTYGASDQEDLFAGLRERLERLWDWIRGGVEEDEASGALDLAPAGPVQEAPDGEGGPGEWDLRIGFWGTVALVVAGLFVLLVWGRRGPPSVTETWVRGRRWLVRQGVEADASIPPRELLDRAVRRFPSMAEPGHRLLAVYLRESFAGEAVGSDGRRRAVEVLAEIQRSVGDDRVRHRKALRRARRLKALSPS